MKALTFILLLLIGHGVMAGEKYPEQPSWDIISKTPDSTLKKNRTRITFRVSGLDLTAGKQKIVWSANKFEETIHVSAEKNSISKVFISGNYKFMFYANSKYEEIIISKLLLESGYSIVVELNFKSTERNMMVKKPVIYLYPKITTDVHLKVNPKGSFTFTYPEHGEQGWDVTAHPNGDLVVNDQTLNYLFWEAEQPVSKGDFDLSKGSLVAKENTIEFLTRSLTGLGLNTKEQADFITFWGPQLQQNERNFIHFVLNEEAAAFGELEISPAPDHVYRVYLLYYDASNMRDVQISPQELPNLERNGFTVIEWGGSDLTEISM